MVKIRTNNTEAIINQLADKTYGTSISSETEDRTEKVCITVPGRVFDKIYDIVRYRRKSKLPNSTYSDFVKEAITDYFSNKK